MTPQIIILDSCDSTNTHLADMTDAVSGTVVAARCQTAGRGQRGNSWESEPGKNITFSMLVCTGWPARRQFELSMIVAIAITDSINNALANAGKKNLTAKVKWPNDIYVGDKKICGILIEHRLCGNALDRSILGIGININQEKFLSNAPNPVSLLQLTGREENTDAILTDVCSRIAYAIDNYSLTDDADNLKRTYMSRLWRYDGIAHPFALPDGTKFYAEISDVALDGMLTLSNGKTFAFKEVIFLLNE